MARRCACIALLAALAGCEHYPWPQDNPGDPTRCDPRCPAGKRCVEGACLPWDGGPTDGPCSCPPKCPLGCNKALCRCNRLLPSNFTPDDALYGKLQGAVSLTAEKNDAGQYKATTIDTTTGEIKDDDDTVIRPAGGAGTVKNGIYWALLPQSGSAPTLSLFGLASLTVPKNRRLDVTGKNALVLYVRESVVLEGYFRLLPINWRAGPGGKDGGAFNGNDGVLCDQGQGVGGKKGNVASDGGATLTFYPGGGGGGNAERGGVGGAAGPLSGGNRGQKQTSSTPSLVPLVGGCGGGAGGGPSPKYQSSGGYGGGGGGAIQVTCDGSITISGILTAPGAGGDGGHHGAGGGGGGAGGAILLEAPSISIGGSVVANGGSGAAGSIDLPSAWDGESGTNGTTPAPGGATQPTAKKETGAGTGGCGSCLGQEQGGDAVVATLAGGGGGGAVGRIRINAPTLSDGKATYSPTPSKSKTLKVW